MQQRFIFFDAHVWRIFLSVKGYFPKNERNLHQPGTVFRSFWWWRKAGSQFWGPKAKTISTSNRKLPLPSRGSWADAENLTATMCHRWQKALTPRLSTNYVKYRKLQRKCYIFNNLLEGIAIWPEKTLKRYENRFSPGLLPALSVGRSAVTTTYAVSNGVASRRKRKSSAKFWRRSQQTPKPSLF